MPSLVKTCVTCKIEKSETDYYSTGTARKDGSKGKRIDCKDCCRKRRRDYFYNPEKRKRINERRRKDYANDAGYRKRLNKQHALKALYNLTVEQYESLKSSQNSKCAICDRHESELQRGLFVDHDHANDDVRGLLCANCNNGLGHFKDNETFLISAANYLSKRRLRSVG